MSEQLSDQLDRPLRSLRVSVTDRCNLRCQYCMPEDSYAWLPKGDLLTFEEIARAVGLFSVLGVNKVRLTGGEPLLRRNLPDLVRLIAGNERLSDLALTTNGMLLAEQAEALRSAGLVRVTVSLDTLRADRFLTLTRRYALEPVLEALAMVAEMDFQSVKIDAVILKGSNEDKLVPLIEHSRKLGVEVRFIEYMDVGGATRWSFERVFTKTEMLDAIRKHYGTISNAPSDPSSPARRYQLKDGTVFGIIASATEPFCRTCDRSRLTADGIWYRCLYAMEGTDLRKPLRENTSDAELIELLQAGWASREDRGAELRKEVTNREALVEPDKLKQDPHLEMHTRGG